MGREGARILLERIAYPARDFVPEIVLQPELIVRESTGVARPSAVSEGSRKQRRGNFPG